METRNEESLAYLAMMEHVIRDEDTDEIIGIDDSATPEQIEAYERMVEDTRFFEREDVQTVLAEAVVDTETGEPVAPALDADDSERALFEEALTRLKKSM